MTNFAQQLKPYPFTKQKHSISRHCNVLCTPHSRNQSFNVFNIMHGYAVYLRTKQKWGWTNVLPSVLSLIFCLHCFEHDNFLIINVDYLCSQIVITITTHRFVSVTSFKLSHYLPWPQFVRLVTLEKIDHRQFSNWSDSNLIIVWQTWGGADEVCGLEAQWLGVWLTYKEVKYPASVLFKRQLRTSLNEDVYFSMHSSSVLTKAWHLLTGSISFASKFDNI